MRLVVMLKARGPSRQSLESAGQLGMFGGSKTTKQVQVKGHIRKTKGGKTVLVKPHQITREVLDDSKPATAPRKPGGFALENALLGIASAREQYPLHDHHLSEESLRLAARDAKQAAHNFGEAGADAAAEAWASWLAEVQTALDKRQRPAPVTMEAGPTSFDLVPAGQHQGFRDWMRDNQVVGRSPYEVMTAYLDEQMRRPDGESDLPYDLLQQIHTGPITTAKAKSLWQTLQQEAILGEVVNGSGFGYMPQSSMEDLPDPRRRGTYSKRELEDLTMRMSVWPELDSLNQEWSQISDLIDEAKARLPDRENRRLDKALDAYDVREWTAIHAGHGAGAHIHDQVQRGTIPTKENVLRAFHAYAAVQHAEITKRFRQVERNLEVFTGEAPIGKAYAVHRKAHLLEGTHDYPTAAAVRIAVRDGAPEELAVLDRQVREGQPHADVTRAAKLWGDWQRRNEQRISQNSAVLAEKRAQLGSIIADATTTDSRRLRRLVKQYGYDIDKDVFDGTYRIKVEGPKGSLFIGSHAKTLKNAFAEWARGM